jgi:cytochrome c oxidase subunit 4
MADTEHAPAHPAAAAHVGHVVPVRLLVGVWAALVALTIVTVAVTYIPAEYLGPFTLWVALGIAGLKAALVALYFMHLRWDRPLNGVIMVISILVVIMFVGGALTDTTEYQGDMIPGYAPSMQRPQPSEGSAP